MQHVHVVRGEAEAGSVREVFGNGSGEAVVYFRDALEVGPLSDIDLGGTARRVFWSGLGVDGEDDESKKLAEIRAADSVTVWHGEHPGELLLFLRVASLLETTGTRLYEVPWAPECDDRGRRIPTLIGAPREKIERNLARKRVVSSRRELAERWARLCVAGDTMFRRLRGGKIEELPVTGYDAEIVSACGDGWRATYKVVIDLHESLAIGDIVAGWRLHALVEAGVLEARGSGPYGSAEVRLAP